VHGRLFANAENGNLISLTSHSHIRQNKLSGTLSKIFDLMCNNKLLLLYIFELVCLIERTSNDYCFKIFSNAKSICRQIAVVEGLFRSSISGGVVEKLS